MREFVSKARESTYLVRKMGSTINIGIIAFGVALWLAAILHVSRQVRKKETINLNILWILGIVFFLSGLGVQAMNMSKIYSNICCGPDTEEIAQKVKKALVYRYAFHGLTIASLMSWLVLRSIKKNDMRDTIFLKGVVFCILGPLTLSPLRKVNVHFCLEILQDVIL